MGYYFPELGTQKIHLVSSGFRKGQMAWRFRVIYHNPYDTYSVRHFLGGQHNVRLDYIVSLLKAHESPGISRQARHTKPDDTYHVCRWHRIIWYRHLDDGHIKGRVSRNSADDSLGLGGLHIILGNTSIICHDGTCVPSRASHGETCPGDRRTYANTGGDRGAKPIHQQILWHDGLRPLFCLIRFATDYDADSSVPVSWIAQASTSRGATKYILDT